MSLLWDIWWVNNLKPTRQGTRGALVVISGCLRSWSATWNMLKMFFLTLLMLEVLQGVSLPQFCWRLSALCVQIQILQKKLLFWQSLWIVEWALNFGNKLFLLTQFSTNSSVLSLPKQITYLKYLLFWFFGPLRLLVCLWPNVSSRAEIVKCVPVLERENEC